VLEFDLGIVGVLIEISNRANLEEKSEALRSLPTYFGIMSNMLAIYS
jgi:hypothetical protein